MAEELAEDILIVTTIREKSGAHLSKSERAAIIESVLASWASLPHFESILCSASYKK